MLGFAPTVLPSIEHVCQKQVHSMISPINEYTLENNTVFSIEGRGLKLNTAEDVQAFVDTILQMDDLQVLKLSGNTIGVEAGKALAGSLQSKKNIRVSFSLSFPQCISHTVDLISPPLGPIWRQDSHYSFH
jgi:hypothetical protein